MQNRFTHRLCGCQSPYSLFARLVAGLALAALFAGLSAGLAVADPPADSTSQAGDGEPRSAEDRTSDAVLRTSNEDIIDNPFLRNALSRSHEGLEVTRESDGTLTLDLKGRFQNVTTATINADGKIETRCGHNHESLKAFRAAHPDAEPPASEPARDGEGGDDR